MHILHDQTAKDLLGAAALEGVSLRELTDCVALLDVEGCIVEHSDGVKAELMDATTAQIKGSPFWSIWPEDTQAALKCAVSRGLDGRITQYWSRYEHADGSTSQWDIRLSPVHDARDQVGAVLAVSRKLSAQ